MANSKLFLTDNNFSQSSTSYAKNYCQFSIGDAFAIELFAMAHQAKASRRTDVILFYFKHEEIVYYSLRAEFNNLYD